MKINTLLQNTGMWRASSIDCTPQSGTPTGFPTLDCRLSGGGWPRDGIIELIHDRQGIGEMRLLAPALARLSREQARWLLWVTPPFTPYAPALAHAGIDLSTVLVVTPRNPVDILWVLEKALSSKSCSAVLAWPDKIRDKDIRRLQVASREGHCLGILFRPTQTAKLASPAELRIRLHGRVPASLSESSSLELQIIKRRGGWSTDPFTLDFDDRLNQVTPDFSEIPVTRTRLLKSESTLSDGNPTPEFFHDIEHRQ